MTLPIRAYLMLRDGQDDWSVEVCRDWQAVLDAWARRQSLQCTGVLHIGFDRPPSSAFEHVAAEHPGRMLYSASARHGLPPGFDASDLPIGHVGELPIHLALKGWGYLVDPLEVAVVRKLHQNAAEEPVGWVKHFLSAREDFRSEFADAGISDDEKYLQRESELSPEARLRAGQFRCRSMLGDAHDDPCALAAASPPWLEQRPLDTISFPVRAANVFAGNGFAVVGDLAATTLDKLLELPNFGRKSAREVVAALNKALDEGPNDIASRVQRSSAETLMVEIHRAVAALDDREGDILARRMGLGRATETLQSIADTYDLTRERIRQIEGRVVRKLVRECYWDDLLSGKLEALLDRRTFPLPLMGVEALDSWFAGVAASPDALRYVLANFCGDKVGLVTIDGVEYLGFLTQERWDSALREAIRALSLGAIDRWTEQHCRAVISPIMNQRAAEFRGLLWSHATRLCHFVDDPNGVRVLASYGRGAEQMVEAILLEAEHPLHYTEISERAEKRIARAVDIRRIHNAAANVGILLDRGTYGLEKHLALSPEVVAEIQEEAARIVSSGPSGRQWHVSELHSSLMESGIVDDTVDKYRIDFVLRGVPSLRRLGRMTWSVSTEAPDDVARIDIRQGIIAILEAAGAPLSSQEIRQRLVALRGVNTTFQIFAGDPIIRIDHGRWGLNDRDVPLKRAEQYSLISEIVEQLNSLGRGIHVSELWRSVAHHPVPVPASIVAGIAISDPRVRLSYSQYLYLAEWGDPRRESLLDAVRSVMIDAAGPMAFDVIFQAVAKRLERVPARPAVSASLQSVGATYDPSTEVWSFSGAHSDVIDEDEPTVTEEEAASAAWSQF